MAKVAAFNQEVKSRALGERLCQLVECRQSGDPPEDKLQKWLDSITDDLREKLDDLDLVQAVDYKKNTTLAVFLDGERDAQGKVSYRDFVSTWKPRAAPLTT